MLLLKLAFVLALFTSTSLFAEEESILLDAVLEKDTLVFGEEQVVTLLHPQRDGRSGTVVHPGEFISGGTVRVNSVVGVFDTATTVRFTPFHAGLCTIPNFKAIYPNFDGKDDTLFFERLTFFVAPQEELAKSIRGFGNPLRAGVFPWWRIIFVLAIILLIALVVKMIWQKRAGEKEVEIYVVPPYNEAVDAIEKLKDRDLLTKGELKNFTFELSRIARRYLGRINSLPIEEATASEFRQWLRDCSLESDWRSFFLSFNEESELIKFANFTPSTTKLNGYLEEIERFVDITKPETDDKGGV